MLYLWCYHSIGLIANNAKKEVASLLSERKLEIVLALVYEYIQTGEPVGSRTITKKYLTGHSAATVRNEMSDLEEAGYLTKPHSSAGRIPGERAYRLYVDSILSRGRTPQPAVDALVQSLDLQLEGLDARLKEVSGFMSRLAGCLGLAALTVTDEPQVRKVDLVALGPRTVLLLVVGDDGSVCHQPVVLPLDLDEDTVAALDQLLNKTITGQGLSKAGSVLRSLSDRLGGEGALVLGAFAETLEGLSLKGKKTRYDATGVTGLYQSAALGELDRPEDLMRLVEEPQALESLIHDVEGGISVTLGGENTPAPLKDCAVVLASGSSGGKQAVLGLVGPLRMNYVKSIALLDALMASLMAGGKEF